MKTALLHQPAIVRFLSCVTAILGLGIASAMAAPSPKITLPIGGQEFGPGKKIHVVSTKDPLEKSTVYGYEVVGTCRGTGALAKFVPKGTPIAALFSGIKLKGTYQNPGGNFPIVVFNKKYSKTTTIQGIQVTLSAKVKGGTDANGKVYFDVTNVKIKSAQPLPAGTIKFEGGAKLVITAAPVIQIENVGTSVSESGGTFNVKVSKVGYDACTVQYTTANGTADAEDYTPINGTINFDVKKDTVIIPVTILPNAVNDTNRSFTFTISSPSAGAFLGAKTSITINILDDD